MWISVRHSARGLSEAAIAATVPAATRADKAIVKRGRLKVGIDQNSYLWGFRDPATGQLAGYDVDVAKAIGENLGVKVEFVETPWDSIFAALEVNGVMSTDNYGETWTDRSAS